MSVLYGRRMARGGFFKSLFKGAKKLVKSVTKIPVIGTVAKTALGSLPIVGQVTTAVNAFKKKTPVGIAASPIGGNPAIALNLSANAGNRRPKNRRPKRRPKATRKRKTNKTKAIRKGGGTAKQRAARARFAKAAKKGRIRKGQRL